MEKLKHIINWIVWSLLALYLLITLLTYIPPVQKFIGNRVAQALSSALDTRVEIGRVDIGFINRFIIDDLHLYDQQDRQMLSVARLSAKIDILPLLNGKVSIPMAQLFGANASLYKRDSLSKANFQFVLDALASEDTTSHTPLDLHINSLIVRRSHFSYDQQDLPATPGLLNFNHLDVSDISAHIILKTLTEDSIDVNIKRLGFHDHSGLDIDKLALRLKGGRNGARIDNLQLLMPSSQLQADSLYASYRMEGSKLIMPSLQFCGAIHESHITPSDLRSLYLPLKNYQKPIHFESLFNGSGWQTTVSNLRIFSDSGDLDLRANGFIDLQHPRPAWSARIGNLSLSENIIDFFHKNIPGIPDEISRIGSIRIEGQLSGESDGGLSAQTNLYTDAGSAVVDFLMSGSQTVKGSIKADKIQLGQILADDHFGSIDATIDVNGQLNGTLNAQGLIAQLEYNQYPFTNIGFNGSYAKNDIQGFLKIADPNLAAELEGHIAKSISVQGTVNHIAPKALKLTEQWGDAVFAGAIEADISSRDLNHAEGSLRIRNFSMQSPESEPYHLDNLYLTTGYQDQRHFVSLISDFAKADLYGEYDYTTLPQSFINVLGAVLPTLPGLPPVSDKAHNDFALKLHVYKSDWLQRLLGFNLAINQPITLDARVSDRNRHITLEGILPDFSYDGSRYKNGDIHIISPRDTILCNLNIAKLMDDGSTLDLSLGAHAANNHLTTSLQWDNKQPGDDRLSGILNTVTNLYRNIGEASEAHIQVQPSHINLGNTTWQVDSADVIYSADRLSVSQFSIHNGLQHIIVDGIASKSRQDSLTVDLNGVEVDYILDLVNFHAVEFSGEASGTAIVKAPFGDFAANARLAVDNFKFERGRMGTLYADVEWNEEAKQIDIHAVADDGPDAKTNINGYVSPTYNAIDLKIGAQGTYVDFMHNFTESFLTSITGHADGLLRLAGSLDEMNLTGNLVVNGEATVTALNTTYQLRGDTVVFIPDDIQLNRMSVYDQYGNRGYLSGGIHHESLTNLTFDLFVEADNLLAYDFKDFGESTFYGTVFASGNVSIQGRNGEVTIDCNVTPQKNSVFVYNASSPDEITNHEFIEWGSGSEKHKTNGEKSVGRTADDEEEPTDIYINFLVNCTPDATLRLLMDANTNDYITLNGEGTIRATFHNKGPFNMFGTYTVDHGTYGVTIQNIIKKNFTFNRGGTIIFGGDPYNAALNLQAVYTVNGVSLSDLNIGNSFASNTIRVNCLMNIGGQPNSPQVDFDLEMPTVNADEQQMVRSIINGQQEMNQQVLYLLGIGRFYNQGQNNAAGQMDQTTLAMQSFLSGTLSTQINTLLNTIIKNNNWNFGANISTGDEGWHNAEYEGLVSGRMLNNRLLINGQFGYRDNARQASPSFIGDFDLQYLLYPNGNLALKVYNQTNDRYFTKSSLNTQGLGLIMKKDFDGLNELFSTKKRTKKRSPKP